MRYYRLKIQIVRLLIYGRCGSSETRFIRKDEEDQGTENEESTLKLTETPHRSTYPRPDAHTARARSAGSTPNTRSHNTKLERCGKLLCDEAITRLIGPRHPCLPKESVDMIANNPVMVVRQNPFSTRRPRQRRRSC